MKKTKIPTNSQGTANNAKRAMPMAPNQPGHINTGGGSTKPPVSMRKPQVVKMGGKKK